MNYALLTIIFLLSVPLYGSDRGGLVLDVHACSGQRVSTPRVEEEITAAMRGDDQHDNHPTKIAPEVTVAPKFSREQASKWLTVRKNLRAIIVQEARRQKSRAETEQVSVIQTEPMPQGLLHNNDNNNNLHGVYVRVGRDAGLVEHGTIMPGGIFPELTTGGNGDAVDWEPLLDGLGFAVNAVAGFFKVVTDGLKEAAQGSTHRINYFS